MKKYFGVNIGEYLYNTYYNVVYKINFYENPYLYITNIDGNGSESICLETCCYDKDTQCGISPTSTADFIGIKTIEQVNKIRTFR